MICLLASYNACQCIFTHADALTQTCSLSRESACEFNDTGEEKCKCASLQVSDMTSMGRWMSACVRERRRWWRERFGEWDGAGSLCIWCISSCPHALCCERTCLSGSENRCNSLRRIWLCQVLFCLRTLLISFFLYPPFSSVTCLGRPQRRMQVMLHIFPFPFFIVLISLSPMLLLLQSQVASRVRAGFVEAHAFWRDTVTDLIAKRKRWAVREMEIRSNTVWKPFSRNVAVTFEFLYFSTLNTFHYTRHFSEKHGFVGLTLWGRH